jgi:hypothetical protein
MKKLTYFNLRTRKQLAVFYGFDVRTFNYHIKSLKKKIGITKERIFTPKQVKAIIDHLGLPGDLDKFKKS